MKTSALLPAAKSSAADHVDGLIRVFGWVSVGFFLLVVLLLGVSVFARRRRDGSGKGRNRWVVRVELSVAAVFAVCFLTLMKISGMTARRMSAAAGTDAGLPEFELEILAQQYFWTARFPGADGEFGNSDLARATESNPFGLDRTDPAAADDMVTHNELFLPVERTSRVRLRSRDVIHAFYVPELRVQQDILPGTPLDLYLRPTRAGQYELACNQYCGYLHHTMRAVLTAGSDAEFATWVASRTTTPPAAAPGNSAR